MKTIVILLAVAGLAACGPYERLDQSCLNDHVRSAPGRLVPTPDGGWAVEGTGPVYTSLVVTQSGAAPLPADAGGVDVEAERTPMRGLVCHVME